MADLQFFPLIIGLAFACELVDSALGMGYGTTLTPVLLILGYQPAEIVPAVLFSECITGFLAGIFHHEFGNVNLRPGSRDFKVTVMLSGMSVLGVVAAVLIAVRLPTWAVKLYVGVLVLAIGLALLWSRNRTFRFTWGRVAGLGALAAFNKGISGGGYGPVVTGGQVLSGVGARSAIGIASLAESVASFAGVITYLVAGSAFPTLLTPSLLLGAVVSVPLAAFAVSRSREESLTRAIGTITTLLGGYTLYQVLF
ncbi:MAG: sulfite exporter TauE/SafE family protein [Anaerolineae bacterium]